jgi:hypothetical protein
VSLGLSGDDFNLADLKWNKEMREEINVRACDVCVCGCMCILLGVCTYVRVRLNTKQQTHRHL